MSKAVPGVFVDFLFNLTHFTTHNIFLLGLTNSFLRRDLCVGVSLYLLDLAQLNDVFWPANPDSFILTERDGQVNLPEEELEHADVELILLNLRVEQRAQVELEPIEEDVLFLEVGILEDSPVEAGIVDAHALD